MATTWDMVRTALETAHRLKHERGDQWRGSCPFRAGSDGNTFVVNVALDGEHGKYFDHKDQQGGSLYDLAAKLNITPVRQAQAVTTTKRRYTSLKEYAEAHGAPVEAYQAARWSELMTYQNRPAFEFPTRGGTRYRFVDGEKPTFKSQSGYKQCWYGLDKAVDKALSTGRPVVFCNGEPSVIAGQHWGIPAATIAGGEQGHFETALLSQLTNVYGGKILVALDCDYHGTTRAFALAEQLRAMGADATAIDLGLGNGGDVADFCKLYTDIAASKIVGCEALEVRAAFPEQLLLPDAPVLLAVDDLYCSDIDALRAYTDEMTGDATPKSPPLLNPFAFLHPFGGLGHIIPAGKLLYFASVSGGTKTIGFETGWEAYQDMGIHSIIYSPEWVDGKENAIEFAARSVQRAGGSSFDEWQANRMALAEATTTVKSGAAKAFDPHEIGRNANMASHLMSRPGRAFYIKNPRLSVEQLCEAIRLICEREAKNGIVIRAVWLDFAQLLWLQNGGDKGRTWIEVAINMVKDVCREKNLVGFVSSQMRKNDAENARGSGDFDASMMQWLSDQQANFVFMFVPVVENGEPVMIHDKHNPNVQIGLLRGKVLKNSLAKPSTREIQIPVNFSRLRWMVNGMNHNG